MTAQQIFFNLLQGGVVTLEIAAGAWCVATVLGLMLSLLRDTRILALVATVVTAVTVLRSVPQLVVLYIFYFGLGAIGIDLPPLLAAILAIGITEACFTAEYYRAGFLTVPESQRDAGKSLGLSHLGVLRLVMIPQTVPYVVPPLLNSFVGLLKTATLASAVGAPEILYQGEQAMVSTGVIVPIVAVVIAVYLVVTIPLTRLVRRLETRTRSHAYG